MMSITKEKYSFANIWVLGTGLGIFLMILVGGYTRLMQAGLSIVDWRPVTGIIPPLSPESWQLEWLKYQTSPEFMQGIVGDFGTFKKLFLIEYIHRLLARALGLWIICGTVYQTISRTWPIWLVRSGYVWCFFLILQGWMGWHMVKSGLIHDPHVSPYRLAVHLWVALGLLSLVWFAWHRLNNQKLKLYAPNSIQISRILIGITITYGALVAGHKAGLIYNTFPLMEGFIIAPDAWYNKPLWANIFSNPTCVQAIHRCLAWMSLISIAATYYNQKTKESLIWLALASFQATLGAITILSAAALHPALTHQAFGVVLWLWGLKVQPKNCLSQRSC